LQGPLKNLYTQTPVIIAEKKKPTYGKAVVDGKLRYVSASAISAFDPSSDGGCPSRWYFEKIEGRKTPETKSQAVGTEAHGQIEHYLKTGERTLGTVVEPGARFLPAPGSDLLIEETFGDWQQALTLRDAVLRGEVPEDAPSRVTATVCNIPVMGAMDLRHRRGEWVDTFGELRREASPEHTAEIVDWKTTKDIEKWGKRADELHLTVQMPLYAKATTLVWPDVNFVRISHGQFGTARREARKVSALLDQEAIAWRFGQIESMVRSMQHTALEASVSSVEKNINACGSYGGCPHKSYCDRPMGSIKQLFQITGIKEKTEMSNGLWGDVAGTTNGVQATPTAPPPAAPVLSQISDAQRLEIIAAEKTRLNAETAPTAPPAGNNPVAKAQAKIMAGTLRLDDSGQVFDKESADNGWVMRQPTTAESIAFEEMAKINTPPAAPVPAAFTPAAPVPTRMASINPPEMPGQNLVASASALPAHVIAEITDPTLKARAEAHAAAHAANAEATTGDDKAEKAKSRCAGGGQRIVLSMDDAMAKKTICAVCKREMKLKPVKENGQWVATISGHLTSKGEPAAAAAAPPAPPAPAAPLPVVAAPISAVPPVPFSEMMQAMPAAPPAPPVQEVFVTPPAPVSTMAAIPPAPPAVVYSQVASAPLSTNDLLAQINDKLQIIIDRIRV